MRQKRERIYVILSLAFLALIVILIFIDYYKKDDGDGKTGVEKNVGISYIVQEINADGSGFTEFSASQVVPAKEELIQNLKDHGYSIENNKFDNQVTILGEQMNAVKGNEFVSIVYELSEREAEEVFHIYEEKFLNSTYYVLARNENFVYCISSHKAFKDAGFEALSTDGILYVNHDNY